MSIIWKEALPGCQIFLCAFCCLQRKSSKSSWQICADKIHCVVLHFTCSQRSIRFCPWVTQCTTVTHTSPNESLYPWVWIMRNTISCELLVVVSNSYFFPSYFPHEFFKVVRKENGHRCAPICIFACASERTIMPTHCDGWKQSSPVAKDSLSEQTGVISS